MMTQEIKEIIKKIDRAKELVPFGFYYDEEYACMSSVVYASDISFMKKDLPKGYRYMVYSKDNSFTDYFYIKEKAPVYDYVRIKPEDFPKYEDLSSQQSIFLSNKIMELLRVYQFEFEFPKRYPKKKYYPILLKAMFKEFLFYDSEYEHRLPLCDFDYKNCVFGKRRYCQCRKDARLERRLIRKGILICDESETDADGKRSYYLAPHIKTKPIDDDFDRTLKDGETPF